MKRTERASLAQETLRIIEEGGYHTSSGEWVDLREPVQRCLDATRLYLPDELRALTPPATAAGKHPQISIVASSTLEVAAGVAAEGENVVILNFASARNAGGGFLNGSEAQEESLARSSALYVSQTRCPEFYAYHRDHADTLYSHRMIVSPRCPVIRNDDGDLLAAPHFPTFITSPAPNAGAVKRNQPDQVHRIVATLRERAALLFKLAAHWQADTLILGAWGCGVFQNEPSKVAAAFAELLDPAAAAWPFRRVIFAIFDRSPGTPVLNAFQDRLGPLCHA